MCGTNKHIRHVDELGRIVIPAELRHAAGLETGAPVALSFNGNAILLEPHTEKCVICGSTRDLHSVDHGFICRNCAQDIIKNFTL